MTDERQDRDFKWYVGELPGLYRQYGRCFAIISDQSVIATYKDYDEAIDAAIEMSDSGKVDTFIVQEIGPDDSVYTSSFASAWVIA